MGQAKVEEPDNRDRRWKTIDALPVVGSKRILSKVVANFCLVIRSPCEGGTDWSSGIERRRVQADADARRDSACCRQCFAHEIFFLHSLPSHVAWSDRRAIRFRRRVTKKSLEDSVPRHRLVGVTCRLQQSVAVLDLLWSAAKAAQRSPFAGAIDVGQAVARVDPSRQGQRGVHARIIRGPRCRNECCVPI